MSPGLHLILHNLGCIICIFVSLGLCIFTYVNNPRRTVNIVFSLTLFFVFVFYLSHLIGVNIADGYLSRTILMFNLSIILVVVLNAHSVLAILGDDKKKRGTLIFMYAVAFAAIIFFLVFPDTFLLPSQPKMYFPNYYVPGSLHWAMRAIFNGIIAFYILVEMIISLKKSTDPVFRNRVKFLLIASMLAYITGVIPVLLIFNIQVDPAWGILFIFFFAIPVLYAIVQYELLDIKIIAKKAFAYMLAVIGVGGFIILLDVMNQWLQSVYPGFPFWFVPFISALLVVFIGIIVWRKLKESDVLKYEFITTATHKFRTPLTHIKWATENLVVAKTPEEQLTQIKYIQDANSKLVELTNVLFNASEAEDSSYKYHMERCNISSIVEAMISSLGSEAEAKHISLVRNVDPEIRAVCDLDRIKFIIQTFIENAVHYTPKNGTISVDLHIRGREAILSVKDSGIGISKDELTMLFSKFYRGREARLTDTEGMGIGLFISKEIIAHHHGKIWAQSDGSNKGSTFFFSLQAIK